MWVFYSYSLYPVITFQEDSKDLSGRFFILDRNGEVITDKSYKNGYYKPLETKINIENKFIQELILVEDKNYFSHFWISIFSKWRAFRDNTLSWKIVSGGSTLTEQLVKNKYFKYKSRSYLQKLREANIAMSYEIYFSKEEILEKYLNSLYFWNNLYGVQSAIETYFWKYKLDQLSESERWFLIGLLRYPWIKTTTEKHFQDYIHTLEKRLNYKITIDFKKLPTRENIDNFPFVTKIFLEKEKNILVKNKKNSATIDAEFQEYSREMLQKTLKELSPRNVTNWAIFAINPKNGEILIYQWSKDFYSNNIEWQFDVIKAKRQPGSTMKPFLYLMGLEKWAWLDSLLVDLERSYDSFQEGKSYISTNYSLKEYGLVSYKKALWNSFNNATVRLAQAFWLQDVYEYYQNFWFEFLYWSEHYWYSLVLWNPNVSLYDMVHHYKKLVPNENSQSKFLLYQLLSSSDNRDISFWVNSILNTSIPQAVKTWTSSNFRDNWVISYHPDLVVWVWVWNNDNSSMKWVTGITWAGYIWHQIIEKAIDLGYITNTDLQVPDWLLQKKYCLDEQCFRSQLEYMQANREYHSHIYNKKYSEQDMIFEISDKERQRLDELGFYLEK